MAEYLNKTGPVQTSKEVLLLNDDEDKILAISKKASISIEDETMWTSKKETLEL
jgi:hypothetical protein